VGKGATVQPRYRVRYFFDYGSGTCLWSANDAARGAFGYPIDPGALPLTPQTVAEIGRLCAWFDTSLNWDYPPDPGPWSQEECDRFNHATRSLLTAVAHELASDFEVLDEQPVLHEDRDLDRHDPRHLRRR
jgi:hypothetical protein